MKEVSQSFADSCLKPLGKFKMLELKMAFIQYQKFIDSYNFFEKYRPIIF